MTILFYLLVAVVLLYSIILHEIAHGKAAELMGDSTARLFGRLTLNPLPHLDPFGTILPILLMLIGSPVVFGWAKPVPINPYNFSDYRRGMIWVSVAGILANLFLAWVLGTIVRLLPVTDNSWFYLVQGVLIFGAHINVVLAVFNLIPLPPLDGSKLLALYLPAEYEAYMRQIEPYGFIILLFILTFPPTQSLLWFIIDFVSKLLMLRGI